MTTFASLSVLTIESRTGTALTGFALLTAERDNDRWHFSRTVDVADNVEAPHHLLELLADRLPMPDVFIGWQIDALIVEPVKQAALAAPPVLRYYALARLARLRRGALVDLAVGNGVSAGSLAEAAKRQLVNDQIRSRANIDADWWVGDRSAVATALCAEALAQWQIFLSLTPKRVSGGAIAATEHWVSTNS